MGQNFTPSVLYRSLLQLRPKYKQVNRFMRTAYNVSTLACVHDNKQQCKGVYIIVKVIGPSPMQLSFKGVVGSFESHHCIYKIIHFVYTLYIYTFLITLAACMLQLVPHLCFQFCCSLLTNYESSTPSCLNQSLISKFLFLFNLDTSCLNMASCICPLCFDCGAYASHAYQ